MTSTGEPWRLGRRPALDGLRGLAVLEVLLSHAFGPVAPVSGTLGVTVFFALSGFLITSLLLAEHERTGKVRLTQFYRRRALRLLPALVVVLATVAALGTVLPFMSPGAPHLLAVLLYVGNWTSVANPSALASLGHTWSLSMEEQFYLVWPLLVLAVLPRLSRRGVLWLSSVGIAAAGLWRVAVWEHTHNQWRVYFGTDTHADALLVGCLVAAWLHGCCSTTSKPRSAALGVIAMIPFIFDFVTVWSYLVVPAVVPWLAALTIAAAVRGRNYTGWLSSRPLVFIGQRSYGLYLWHYPVAFLMWGSSWSSPGSLVQASVIVPASVALCLLSWRYVEQPFLRLKARTSEGGSGGRDLHDGIEVAAGTRRGCESRVYA